MNDGTQNKTDGNFDFFNPETKEFNGIAFAEAFWMMAAPGYCGAEFPLDTAPEAKTLTPATAHDKVLENIIQQAGYMREAGVSQIATADFITGCSRLLEQMADEMDRLGLLED